MANARLQSLLALLVVSTASAQNSGATDPLSPCQKCCSPGGDCSAAYHSEQGKCCGTVANNEYCCPTTANCWPCRSSYRCFTGIRPSSNICAMEGGDSHDNATGITFAVLLLVVLLFCVCSCAWQHHRRHPFVTQNAVVVEMTSASLYPSAVHRNGMPAQGVPVAQAMPACGQQHHVIVQGSYAGHPGYYDRGYHSSGSVALGAGMGFLGGMMVGEMMSDSGDYGGGGYGGGGGGDGGFAADM